jgi:uncharacterized membrane protein
MKLFSEQNLHTLFNAGIIIKAIDSIGEITLGILFTFLSAPTINHIILTLFSDELTEQPRDSIWNFLFHGWTGVSGGSQYFLAFLFLGHGAVKLLLVAGLVKDKLWVYPTAAIAFASFAAYQTYHIIISPSPLLSVLTILDVIFVALILIEYRYQKRGPQRALQSL